MTMDRRESQSEFEMEVEVEGSENGSVTTEGPKKRRCGRCESKSIYMYIFY